MIGDVLRFRRRDHENLAELVDAAERGREAAELALTRARAAIRKSLPPGATDDDVGSRFAEIAASVPRPAA